MPLLRVDRLKLMYAATEVLSDLTFHVEPRQRVGIDALLLGVALPEADQAPAAGALSGGQRRRLALASLLLQDADLLLLDERTNHLDLEAIEWLEGFLRLSRAGMLIVSHDRRFLEQ